MAGDFVSRSHAFENDATGGGCMSRAALRNHRAGLGGQKLADDKQSCKTQARKRHAAWDIS